MYRSKRIAVLETNARQGQTVPSQARDPLMGLAGPQGGETWGADPLRGWTRPPTDPRSTHAGCSCHPTAARSGPARARRAIAVVAPFRRTACDRTPLLRVARGCRGRVSARRRDPPDQGADDARRRVAAVAEDRREARGVRGPRVEWASHACRRPDRRAGRPGGLDRGARRALRAPAGRRRGAREPEAAGGALPAPARGG